MQWPNSKCDNLWFNVGQTKIKSYRSPSVKHDYLSNYRKCGWNQLHIFIISGNLRISGITWELIFDTSQTLQFNLNWLRCPIPIYFPPAPFASTILSICKRQITVHGLEKNSHHFLKQKVILERSSHRRWSIKKGVPKIVSKLTGKHLCQSLF